MPKKPHIARTVTLTLATVALIGSLGFAGTHAYAQPTESDTSISACGTQAAAMQTAKHELDAAKKSGDGDRIKHAEARYKAAKADYEKCMNG